MNIIIRTKNLELTDFLEDFVNSRMGSLKKFIKALKEKHLPITKGKTLSEVFIEIEKETKHHRKGVVFKTEAIIPLPGRKLVAQAKSDDLKKAIIFVRDELKREIRKYKTKTIELPRRKYRKIKRENIP